jgi:hypothetical protein
MHAATELKRIERFMCPASLLLFDPTSTWLVAV